MVLKELRVFFNSHSDNSIEFWYCPSNKKWHLHVSVNKEIKKFDLILLYSSKTSWDFNKKEECDNIRNVTISSKSGNNFQNIRS